MAELGIFAVDVGDQVDDAFGKESLQFPQPRGLGNSGEGLALGVLDREGPQE